MSEGNGSTGAIPDLVIGMNRWSVNGAGDVEATSSSGSEIYINEGDLEEISEWLALVAASKVKP